MTIGGLGLAPGDMCYDPQHPWYQPNWWNDELECQCMAANPDVYPIGQQCASFKGVAQTMGGQAQAVASGAADVVGSVGTGLASGVGGGVADSLTSNLSGTFIIAGVAVLAYLMLSKR